MANNTVHPKPPPESRDRYSFTLKPSLIALVDQAAEASEISRSRAVERMITSALKSMGLLPDNKPRA